MKNIVLIFACIWSSTSFSQKVVDEIVGIVGSEPILLSEVEEQAQQDFMNGTGLRDDASKCELFEELLFQKMLLDQAGKDSLNAVYKLSEVARPCEHCHNNASNSGDHQRNPVGDPQPKRRSARAECAR